MLGQMTEDRLNVGPCAECRWWHPLSSNEEIGVCMQTAWDARGGHVHASSKAKVQIVGGIGAVLETHADHGCTQWEQTYIASHRRYSDRRAIRSGP
jgi:hypothetical protein